MSATHWDTIYSEKADDETSWFQPTPDLSLELMDKAGATAGASVVDVGGGTSRLVDALLDRGQQDVTVLDVSQEALRRSRERLGERSEHVKWVTADVAGWRPGRTFNVWHDRAVFHFLTEPTQQKAYRETLNAAVAPGGMAIIATFAEDGPTHCSGLPVARYNADQLTEALGATLRVLEHGRHEHRTPWDAVQPFTWAIASRGNLGT